MASNLIAMASNLTNSDGLKPTSDGLQPNSNGLQPNSDGLKPTSDGLQPNSNGLQPNSDGLKPTSDCLQPNSNGLQPNSSGRQLKSDVLKPKSDGLQPCMDVYGVCVECMVYGCVWCAVWFVASTMISCLKAFMTPSSAVNRYVSLRTASAPKVASNARSPPDDHSTRPGLSRGEQSRSTEWTFFGVF